MNGASQPRSGRAPRYRGVFPVVPTTFTESGELDIARQKRCVDFMIDAGSDGLCILANFSEQFVLSDDERQVLKIASLVVIGLVALAALVYAVFAWNRRRCDGSGSRRRDGSGHVLADSGRDQHRRIEQHHVVAPQAHLAVGNQHKLRNGVIDRLQGADMQQGLAARLLDVQLRARWRCDAILACLKAEAGRCCFRRGAQERDGGVQRLTQVRPQADVAQPEGCGRSGMAQTKQEEGGFEVHGSF